MKDRHYIMRVEQDGVVTFRVRHVRFAGCCVRSRVDMSYLTLEAARASLPAGLLRLGRGPLDGLGILEVWA